MSRDELTVDSRQKGDRWDFHEHRDECQISFANTVYHHEQGQLCFWDHSYDAIVYIPLEFKDRHSAYKWIQEGTIADLQESLHNLHVGFTNECFHSKLKEDGHETG